jgi:antirestriction protein ArdC
MTKSGKMSVYESVTERILARLDQGIVDWHKPWVSKSGDTPANLITKKNYQGINPLLLSLAGYSSKYWLSYKQALDLGGHVRRNEKGTQIIKWTSVTAEKSKTGKAYGFLRYFTVFNVEQCDGLEGKIPIEISPEDVKPFSPIDTAEAILNGMPNPPKLNHGGNRACYAPLVDTVTLPNQEDFDTAENYYCTAFHEFAHSTGHDSRLKREFGKAFGNELYSKEELIAEMSAAMLCGIAGIVDTTLDNSAAYIEHWKSQLEADPKLIIQAAGKAQKASDYILGTSFEDTPKVEENEEN